MRSHSYLISARECLKILAAPLLGVLLLAAGLHAARWFGALPSARPIDNPDETLLRFKTQLSCSRHPAQIILLGDSSCATGIDAPKLQALLPNRPGVLNLALFIGFGLDVHQEILADYVRHNPGQVQLVVLLVTPQFLTDENVVPSAYESWRRLHLAGENSDDPGTGRWSRLCGTDLLKERLSRQVLHTPIRGSPFYGFSSVFAQYLARHEGSMLEPGEFHPTVHPNLKRYYLAPTLEKASREFRRCLPPGAKLAVGLTPLPESLCRPDYLQSRNELLVAWSRWIGADYVLTNAPVKLSDPLFATGAHLNGYGQERFTRQLGALLTQVWSGTPPLSECQMRTGLPNVFAKLEAGQRVRLAYLGGSITAQEGWRPKSTEWFQTQFPAATVEEINAAVSGTGSDVGVFRLRQDVLDRDPDLLFIEFAVNDAEAPPEQIQRCFEGMVRQAWKQNPTLDICFVYTLDGNLLEALKQEKLPRSVAAMEQVAAHYGIPAINMGLEIARLEKAGKLVFQGGLPTTAEEKAAAGQRIVFSPDSVHPYPETGHQLYLEVLVHSMERMRKEGRPGPHSLPAAFVAANWEAARIEPLSRARLSSGWQRLQPGEDYLARRFNSRLPEIWKATQPGESITFDFRGSAAFISDLLGPDCGQVIVKIDQQKPVVIPRFDIDSRYHHVGRLTVAEGLSNTLHHVQLTMHHQPPDKAKILGQRHETIDDPSRYAGTAWYAGAILVVGELVE